MFQGLRLTQQNYIRFAFSDSVCRQVPITAVQCALLRILKWKFPVSYLGAETDCSERFGQFSSETAASRPTSNWATTASFHMLSSSLLTLQLLFRRY